MESFQLHVRLLIEWDCFMLAFTTTELSKLLTSLLTAVKKHVVKYCEKVYERSGKNLFWSITNSGEV